MSAFMSFAHMFPEHRSKNKRNKKMTIKEATGYQKRLQKYKDRLRKRR